MNRRLALNIKCASLRAPSSALKRRLRPVALFLREHGVVARAHGARAWLHRAQGSRGGGRKGWPPAAQQYTKGASNVPAAAKAQYRTAAAFAAAGDMDAAKQAYHAAFRLDPEAPPILERVFARNVHNYAQRRTLVDFVLGILPEVRAKARAEIAALPLGPAAAMAPRVFSYWGQGFNQAPAVVQACRRELLRHHRPEDARLLDSRDFQYYVDLPPGLAAHIGVNKAHFSDVLRVALLAKWGGIWSDATCLVTENLPSRFGALVGTSGFFAFPNGNDGVMSNWFLASAPGNYVVCMMKHALLAYWEHHDRAVHYLFFHQIFRTLYIVDPEFQRLWDARSHLAGDPRAVIRCMSKAMTEAQLRRLLQRSPVHKLTYKSRGGMNSMSALASIVRGDL